MTDGEVLALACELRRFERTAAMAAEAAVDFVASAQAPPGHRFERRLSPRRCVCCRPGALVRNQFAIQKNTAAMRRSASVLPKYAVALWIRSAR